MDSFLLTSFSLSFGNVGIEYSRNSLGYKAKFLQFAFSIILLREINGCDIGLIVTSVYVPPSTINPKNTAGTSRREKDMYFSEKLILKIL